MRPPKKSRSLRGLELDWVIVSVEGIRRWGLVVLFVVLAGGGAAGALYFLHEPPERRAQRLLEKATTIQEEVRRAGITENLEDEFDKASRLLGDARRDFERGDWAPCVARAQESLHRFELLAGLLSRDLSGSGQVVSLQGKVEIQRANETRWESAREKQRLYNGDFIKTSKEGTADLLFADGTVFRVGPDTLLEVHHGSRGGKDSASGEVMVRVGQVNVYTTTSPSLVLTDAVQAEVDSDSRMGVEVTEDSSTIVANYAGRARVTGKSGERLELGSQQAVRAAPEGTLGRRRAVPDVPLLEEPRANAVINLDKVDRIDLRWRPVLGSTGYHLQVSRSRLFAPSSIEVDVDHRQESSASVQVLRPGAFHWRVSALGPEGMRSEWSPPRIFKASTGPRIMELSDTTPARLEVRPPTQMGHFFLIQGDTEPGATVTINGEPVTVAADGTFKKAVAFSREGWNTILVRAVDPAGNSSEYKKTVLVEVD